MLNYKINYNRKTISHCCLRTTLLVLLFVTYTADAFSQAPHISYPTPQTYRINAPITVLAPTNTGGSVPANTYALTTTFSGLTYPGYANGTISTASYMQPRDVTVDLSGNTYIIDDNNVIRKISPAGFVTTFAGTGALGAANGAGNSASFRNMLGIITDAAGNVYVTDSNNNMIRKVTTAGVVSTLAGNGSVGATNGAGAIASFKSPSGIGIDALGNLYVADMFNNMIRKITPTGIVSTVAGNGSYGALDGTAANATFSEPTDVTVDAAGNLYVADAGNNKIRKVTASGMVTTFAGSGLNGSADGVGAAASFNFPQALTVDAAGNLYVADSFNQSIRKITQAGVVTTIAGSTDGSYGYADGIGRAAKFSYPYGIGTDGRNLYIADNQNSDIRKISLTGYTIDKALPTGLTFDPTTGIVSGTPTALWPPTDYTITAYNSAGSSNTVVNIQVLSIPLIPSVITFPLLHTSDIDANSNIKPGATSTNLETPITYTSSNPSVAIITPDGLIHLLGPGVTVITAYQAGDANYSAATPVYQTLTVTESQVITFPSITAKSTCDADFPAGAISTNNAIPLTYSSSNTAVATISAQGIIHITGIGTTTITVSQDGNTLYTPANPQSQTLAVHNPVAPNVSITANPTSICNEMTVTYTATVSNLTGNFLYQWQVNGVNTGTNTSTFASNHVASTDIVQCIVTNNSSCPTTGTSNSITGILVYPYVTPSITIASTTTGAVCSGTPISFTANPTNGGTSPTYQWRVNGLNVGANSSSFISNNLNNGDLVTCLLTNNGGACLTTSTVLSNGITVSIRPPDNPSPSVTVSPSANGVYAGVLITFTATATNANGTADYQWQVNGASVGINNSVFESSTLNNGDEVACTLTVKNSCTPPVTSRPVLMNILQPVAIRIPNAFTPNGDGINDRWDIPDLAYFPSCVLNIYTRYGSMIYQSRGYTTGWDGLYNGKILPAGTYYYIIDLGNNTPKLAGYVALIK